MTPHTKLTLDIDYTLYGKIENYLMTNDYTIDKVDFLTDVSIKISVENSLLEEFKTTMTNLTNGDIIIKEEGNIFLPLKDGKRLPQKN